MICFLSFPLEISSSFWTEVRQWVRRLLFHLVSLHLSSSKKEGEGTERRRSKQKVLLHWVDPASARSSLFFILFVPFCFGVLLSPDRWRQCGPGHIHKQAAKRMQSNTTTSQSGLNDQSLKGNCGVFKPLPYFLHVWMCKWFRLTKSFGCGSVNSLEVHIAATHL